MLRIFIITTFLFLIEMTCKSQSFYQFRHIGINDGLSQGSIYHIHKDTRGFLWLGTQDGINRFDGKNIQVYLSGASGESTNVQGIAEDSASNLWIGSHKGLYKYIRKSDKFIKPVKKNSFGNKSVHVFSDRKKRIYLLSENGLYRIENNKIKLLTAELTYSKSQFNNFLAESLEGDFWFLDAQKGLKRFSLSEKKVYYYFSDQKNIYGTPQIFNCISFDIAGNMWLGGNQGLMKFDYKKNITSTYLKKINFERNSILDITQDQTGQLWLATEGNGILIYNPDKDQLIQHIQHEEDVSNSLKFNEVSEVYIDENNDVFANTDPQGLDIITAVSSAFSYYTFGKNPLYSLSAYSVRGLAEDADSSIWIGTELGGINRLNPKTGKIKHYNIHDGLPGSIIRYILKDPENKIWVANLNGLSLFDSKLGRFKEIILPITCEVTTITSVGRGLLLLSTNKGLILVDSDKEKVINHSYSNLVCGYTAYKDDSSNLVYVSDRYHGINVFRIIDNKPVLKKKMLENFHVLKIYHKPSSPFLWACTDRGLVKWNIRQDKSVKNYRVTDGLHHEFIYSMLPDEMGFFWLSTNRGLTRFDPVSERFEFIKEIPPREYNTRASLVTKDGNLYFGSTTGLDRIKPKLLTLRNEHVRVHLTEILYDQPDTENDSMYVGEQASLQLSFVNNTISLKFTATDYRSGGLNRYRYFLKGYDKDTVYSGTVNQVRYARLPAGNYEFQLQASDLGGNWVSNVRKLKIQILPPFWQTWWFIISVFLFFAAVIWTSVRTYLNYRLRAHLLMSEKKISIEKERSRIARDINDSLGSELFGLKLLGQVALSQSRREDSDSYLKKIIDVSKSISEKISEVIWLTDSNQDNAESLWSYLQKNALIYLKPSGINYHFDTLPSNELFLISGERRHEILNFYKQLFTEMTRTCDLQLCEIRFMAYTNHLVIFVKNVDFLQMDHTLFLNLEKLRGNLTSSPESPFVMEIPLED